MKALRFVFLALALLAGSAHGEATVAQAPPIKFYYTDNAGLPLVGGKLFTYQVGSATKQDTYADATGNVPNTNPIILDSAGRANIWLDITKSYKFVLALPTDTDPPTSPIWSVDNVSTLNSSELSFIQAGTGAVTRTMQAKAREIVSILDFGASPTKTASENAIAIQAAIDSLIPTGGTVLIPSGTYDVTSLSMGNTDYDGITLVGDSVEFSKLAFTTTGTALTLGANPGGIAWVTFAHLTLSGPNTSIFADIKNCSFCTFDDIRVTETGNTGGASSRGFKLFASMQTVFHKFIYSGNVNAAQGIVVADDSDSTSFISSYIKGEPTASTYSLVLDSGSTSPAHVNTTVQDTIIGGGNTAAIIIGLNGDAGPVRIINVACEGAVKCVQLGNAGGPYYAKEVTIDSMYSFNPSGDSIDFQASRNVRAINNKFYLGGGHDFNFHATVSNNTNIIVELNELAQGYSLPVTQNRIRYQDENGYIHDRLSCITNPTGDVWDPGSIANGAKESKDVTITGSALGDFATGSFNLDIQGMTISAAVKAADTVTVTLANSTGGAIDLGAGVVYARVCSR